MTLWQAGLGSPTAQRVALTTGNDTDILTTSASVDRSVAKVLISNKTGGAVTFNLEAYDGTTAYPLEFGRSLAANTSYELRDELIPRGWSLRAKASSANALTIHVLFSDNTR